MASGYLDLWSLFGLIAAGVYLSGQAVTWLLLIWLIRRTYDRR